ncbi:MAG: hypothetical protein KGJ23_04715 [Euryarchaeota archaeon]|nr:hypothetical protein [Euryarchaeota archaeon]MDE1835901.1 hypothetical protein [Euryarchaeota archaeon]MDE1880224.1 hypothetical protein [Euryarchaeota archaeon]MDE2044421.1 hypothetical protein [Thermoplasmata archaeon]
MPEGPDNFRDVQYYAMLKDMYKAQHAASKSAYVSYCSCKQCNHSWRGDCMKERCACCTSPVKG